MTEQEERALDSRTRRIVLGGIGAYVVVLFVLAITGRFTFVTKTTVVPAVVVLALATGRLRPFVHQWAVYLSLLVLFDAFRGYIYYTIVTLDMTVYMHYVIDLERVLLGGRIGPVWFQQVFLVPGELTRLDKAMTVVHGSHFLFFLLFGLGIWYLRRDAFEDFKVGLLLVMGGGLLGYLIVPTVPPWMAARDFGVLPEIHRVYGYVYNTATPTLRQALDTNPVAAMPSLHTAFPAFICLVALRCWRLRAAPILLYFGAMLFSLTYGGEHYVVDELAGVLLATVVYVLVYIVGVRGRVAALMSAQARGDSIVMRLLDTPIKRKLALTAAILVFAEIIGQLSLTQTRPWRPNAAFVEREMMGRSQLAHLFLGKEALSEGDYTAAQREFDLARTDARTEARRRTAVVYLAQAAFNNRDYDAVVQALAGVPLGALEPQIVALLARAYFESGRGEQGLAVMTRLANGYPGAAQFAFDRGYAGLKYGMLTRVEVGRVIAGLRARFRDRPAAGHADRLQRLMDAAN
ncbi:MAG: phosphatase PAP2 family protein [Nannocystaceae bacterium]